MLGKSARASIAGLLMGASLCALSGAAAASGLSVPIDDSVPVHLSREAASVVVGNPSIADVYVQNGTLVFLQGRTFGTTNLIALDAQGQQILDIPVTVTTRHGQNVTLQRGVDGRITYACDGRCEEMVMPGDDPGHDKALQDISTSKAGEADSVATTGARSSGGGGTD